MNSETSKTYQSNYTLSILEQEYQYILAQHPLDISVDGFSWMMIGMSQVCKCLDAIKNAETYETILALWNHQTKLIEKFAAIRKITLTPEFVESKDAIESATMVLLNKNNN
jgi:hypothetical protein